MSHRAVLPRPLAMALAMLAALALVFAMSNLATISAGPLQLGPSPAAADNDDEDAEEEMEDAEEDAEEAEEDAEDEAEDAEDEAEEADAEADEEEDTDDGEAPAGGADAGFGGTADGGGSEWTGALLAGGAIAVIVAAGALLARRATA